MPAARHPRVWLGLVLVIIAIAVTGIFYLSWYKLQPVKCSGRLNLTVKNEWVGSSTPTKNVKVNLYAEGTRYFYNEKTGHDFSERGVFLVDTVELNESNNWTYSWVDQPRKVQEVLKYGTYLYSYTKYYIREAYPYAMDYAISYEDGEGNGLATESYEVDHSVKFPLKLSTWWDPYENDAVDLVPADGGTVIIRNEQSNKLSNTGAMGYRGYLLGGAALLLVDCVIFFKGRKRRPGGNADEKDLRETQGRDGEFYHR
jgi:hypothetical protein